jgi:uncharacterized protein (DUF4415 family)
MNKSSKTDWAKLETMTDEEIDTSEIPPLPDHFFDKAKLRIPTSAPVVIQMHIEPEILNWFQAQGGDWEARMRAALHLYVAAHQEAEYA